MKKNLRNICLLLITIVGIIYFPMYIYAYDIETLDESTDLTEIENKESDIINAAEAFFEESSNQELTIDYSRAVKIYVDTNIYENTQMYPTLLRRILGNATYLWEVPVRVSENNYVICTVSRKPPITEEVKKELLENKVFTENEIMEAEKQVGQWEIASSVYNDNNSDYIDTISSILEEDYNPDDIKQLFLLGGTPNMRLPFALFEENGRYKILTMEVTTQEGDSASSFSDSIFNEVQENSIYDFEDVQGILAHKTDETNLGDSGLGVSKEELQSPKAQNQYMFVVIICLFSIIIVVSGICYYRHRKKQNKIKS